MNLLRLAATILPCTLELNASCLPCTLACCLAAWIYDRDPFQPLKWQDDLEKFKARLARGEDVFGEFLGLQRCC